MVEDLNYEEDDFADIVAKDSRYHARAYALLADVVRYLSGDCGRHVTGEEVLDEFKERALDLFGPMTYTVLTEWGVHCTEDIGEMMFNLVDARRIARGEHDTQDSFVGGYDFKETFLDPYQA